LYDEVAHHVMLLLLLLANDEVETVWKGAVMA